MALTKRSRRRFQVPGIEGKGDGMTGQLVDGCRGGVAFGDNEQSPRPPVADQMDAARNAPAARETLAAIAVDGLRRLQAAVPVADRQDGIALRAPGLQRLLAPGNGKRTDGVQQSAVRIDAFALQIGMLARKRQLRDQAF
jgi:hypothetical protein